MSPGPEQDGPGPAFVRVAGLGKRYGEAWAVRGVSFTVARGEILGLVGPNGAGKTTTLKMLAGLVEPTEGRAEVGGRGVHEAEHRARVGYLPEESPVYDEMTAPAYLQFFADLYGVPRGLARERVAAALDLLALEAPEGQRLGDMSKGMRRKVALARSLVHDPELLVYDEPASGLDPVVSRTVLDLLGDLRARGKAVVLSAHNLYHLERLCDRVLILHRGAVAAQGSLDEVRRSEGGTEYRVRLSAQVPGTTPVDGGFEAIVEDMAAVQALEEQARAMGGRLLGVTPRDLSLEEIFLRRVAR